MTPKEFTIWLNGFVEACNEYAPTPKQWDALKDQLAKVDNIKSFETRVNQDHPFWTGTSTTQKQLLND